MKQEVLEFVEALIDDAVESQMYGKVVVTIPFQGGRIGRSAVSSDTHKTGRLEKKPKPPQPNG